MALSLNNVHKSWCPILNKSIDCLDESYLKALASNENWIPGPTNVFNAFSLPLTELRYILWGESPYPRIASANGYAFWDAAVTNIWSDKGLSKAVNRATSLRNMIKMLLLAQGLLSAQHMSQSDITQVNKDKLITKLSELFQNLQKHGFLLLNASLVLRDTPVKKEAKQWQPFMTSLLTQLAIIKPDLELILFGSIAKTIGEIAAEHGFKQFIAEHPYNLSFIKNEDVLNFFRPFGLLNA